MTTTQTTFGTVTRSEHGTTVAADGATLYDWAHRGDCRWPCSALARLELVRVDFDSRGNLVGIEGDDNAGLPADELNAWVAECLVRAGYPSHPAIRP